MIVRLRELLSHAWFRDSWRVEGQMKWNRW